MAIKFSQFNLRTDHTSGMYLVGYDGNQNIHITVDNLFDDFINGTENTIAMFGTDGTVLVDSILSQDAGATLLTVAGQLNVDAAATFDTSITVTGDSTLNGNVTLGDASTDLITQTGTLYLNGPVKDTTDTLGAVDQVLLSDAAGELTFTDLADLHVGGAEVVEVPVKNVQGSALVKGDPVYISGSVGASGRLEVQLADASNALKMPAVGLLKQDLANNAEGFAVVTGKLRNLITDPIDGVNPTENDVIYVKPSGTSGAALTTTKPVYGNFIQNIGKVGRVSTSNDGNLVVSSILRTNDIPNLTPGRLWIGSTGNTIESQTLFVDEANAKLGIGTITPATKLDVDGDITSRGDIIIDNAFGDPFLKLKTSGQEYVLRIDRSDNEKFQIRDITNSATRVTLDTSGNIGSGTTSPFAKLHIKDEVNNTGILVESSQATGANYQNSYIDLRAKETSTNTTASGNISIHGVNTLNAAGPKTLQIRNLSFGGADILMTTYDNTNTALNPARFKSSGQVQFEEYGGGAFTGTATKTLAVDASGNIIETAGVSVDGSGTANYVTKWFDTDTITDSVIYDDGTNVGIGTTTPSAKLDIRTTNDQAIFASTSGGYNALEFTSDSGTTTGSLIAYNNTIRLGNASAVGGWSNGIAIDSSGQVGIGTSSPFANLTVYGATDSRIALVNSNTGTTSSDGFVLIAESDSDVHFLNRENSNMFFSTNGSKRMTIDSSGNVGIGTTSPSFTLDIGNSINSDEVFRINGAFSNVLFSGAASAPTGGVGIWNFINTGTTSTTRFYVEDANNADDRLTFRFTGNQGSNEILAGTSSGDVGIGTTDPYAELHIKNTVGNPSLMIESEQVVGGNFQNSYINLRARESSTNTLANATITIHGVNSINSAGAKTLVIRNQTLGGGDVLISTLDSSSSAKNPARFKSSGKVQFEEYGSGTFTGTATKTLAVDINGNVIETDGSGVDGSGTANYVSKWLDADTLTDSVIYDSGTNVGIGTTNPAEELHVVGSTLIEGSSVELKVKGSGSYDTANITMGNAAKADTFEISLRQDPGDNYATLEYDGYLPTGTSHVRLGGNYLDFNTAGSSRMYINSSGNVGINTTAPSQKLDVNGSIKLSQYGSIYFGSNTSDQLTLFNSISGSEIRQSGSGNLALHSVNNGISFLSGYSTKAVMTSVGNFGIGTTSPSAKLNVLNSSTSGGGIIENSSMSFTGTGFLVNNTSNSGGELLRLRSVSNDRFIVGGQGQIGVGGANYGTSGQVLTSSGSGSAPSWQDASSNWTLSNNNIYNNNSGNVGIGTVTPDYTLDVAGNAGIDEYLYHNGDSDTYLKFTNNNTRLYAGGSEGIHCTSNATTLQFAHSFTPSGNFQIGDTAGIFSGMSLRMNGSGSNITFESSAGYKAIYSDISTTYFQTNVGVGVTSPASKLQVNGAVQVANDTATATASKVGALRYRTSGNNSYVDMCMQTGASTYAWVNIIQNSW